MINPSLFPEPTAGVEPAILPRTRRVLWPAELRGQYLARLRPSQGMESSTGFEPVYAALQTDALPLGHEYVPIKRAPGWI